jgi:hypothetical protein
VKCTITASTSTRRSLLHICATRATGRLLDRQLRGGRGGSHKVLAWVEVDEHGPLES